MKQNIKKLYTTRLIKKKKNNNKKQIGKKVDLKRYIK